VLMSIETMSKEAGTFIGCESLIKCIYNGS
jgi:hypothetical protein